MSCIQKHGERGGGGGAWRFLGNQAMSQSRCARTFGFPVGKKKKHVRVQNAIRRLCAAAAAMTAISLFSIYTHRQIKRTRENFLNPPPPSSKHVTPTDSFCESLSLEWEGEEVLLCLALNISQIISRECRGAN